MKKCLTKKSAEKALEKIVIITSVFENQRLAFQRRDLKKTKAQSQFKILTRESFKSKQTEN